MYMFCLFYENNKCIDLLNLYVLCFVCCFKCWYLFESCISFFFLLDEEGDFIVFLIGEELFEVLGFVDNGFFRVFVKLSK